MKSVYFANIWPQIITERGFKLFEKLGYSISGNWLCDSMDFNNSFRILYPYANFDNALIIDKEQNRLWKKVISYILFPDSCVGWDCDKNKYLLKINNNFLSSIEKSRAIISHSNYSLNLIQKTYGDISANIVPLGIDTNSIRSFPKKRSKTLKVLWNNMWRSDKGTIEAFRIIKSLAQKYPEVDFLICQSETWGTNSNSSAYKLLCQPQLRSLHNLQNVEFISRLKKQTEYWELLRQVDIGFSTSFHEGFGLSMMEQEAAEIACVVPNEEVYPELHSGCLISERNHIINDLQRLIEDANLRKTIAKRCLENASKYDIEFWVKSIVKHLNN